ncbi:MOSC domain-containing protein [Bremerella cremea]|uniref:MOSC domain-containing protein n=2 Tax=Bremerella cremea TaxID=1031537 RepID=A0A368KX30_9BACT|nr:MOSC domain-containing protein [Bremerella cremea]
MPPPLGHLHSIQVGRPQKYESGADSTKPWTSAIEKHLLNGPVHVGKLNLAGDEQADLVHHGGPDKAVLAYALGHYAIWKQEIPDRQFSPGAFGENLTLAQVDEFNVCVGDIVRLGTCVLQVSQPRQPCWKLSRRWNLPKLAVEVQKTGRTGWYFRVLAEGEIEPGMPLELEARPYPDFTIAWASSVMYAKPRNPREDLRLAQCPALSQSWQTTLLKRSQGKGSVDDSLRLFGRGNDEQPQR